MICLRPLMSLDGLLLVSSSNSRPVEKERVRDVWDLLQSWDRLREDEIAAIAPHETALIMALRKISLCQVDQRPSLNR